MKLFNNKNITGRFFIKMLATIANWRNNSPGRYIRLLRKNKTMNTKSVIVHHSKNRTSGLISDYGNVLF